MELEHNCNGNERNYLTSSGSGVHASFSNNLTHSPTECKPIIGQYPPRGTLIFICLTFEQKKKNITTHLSLSGKTYHSSKGNNIMLNII